MKKIIACALVFMLIAAFVPATLAAAPAKSVEKTAVQSNVIENGGINNDGTRSTKGTSTVMSSDFSNVNDGMTIKDSTLNTKEEERTWQTILPYFGIELMDQADSFSSGYCLNYSDGEFVLDDTGSFFKDQQAYGMIWSPQDPATKDLRSFDAGEKMFYSFDLIDYFDQGASEIHYFDAKTSIQVGVYMFAGLLEDYHSQDADGGLKMCASYLGDKSVDIKVTAPEDGWCYMFVTYIMDTSLTRFGGWMNPTTYENDYKDLQKAGTISEGAANGVKIDLGSSASKLVLTNDFVLAHAAAYQVELKEGDMLAAVMDSQDSIGGRLMLCDENMDVIGATFIGSGAVANGTPYSKCPLPLVPVYSGTYYIIASGFYMADEGDLEVTIVPWGEVYNELGRTETTIDVSTFGKTDYEDPDGHYVYQWLSAGNFGQLSLVYPDHYTLKGDNAGVAVDLYDSVTVTLDNCTIDSIWLANTWGSAKIIAKGTSTITDDGKINYTMYNYEGSNAGLYITGENESSVLKVSGPLGIVLDNCPVHVYGVTLDSESTGITGSYSIAMWLTGILRPELTFAGATFEDGMQACTMYSDAAGNYQAGHTVSTVDAVHRYGGGDPSYAMIAAEFTVHTKTGGAILRGDANEDGLVNTGDATRVLKHATNLQPLTGAGLANADMNGDNLVNTGDATAILKFAVNK